ncbi:MAG: hypothetical protein JNJ58_02585 [Chitinophagaceae bacterium]|nr:hypothetical protein [Chitinophagaceae bacterium]
MKSNLLLLGILLLFTAFMQIGCKSKAPKETDSVSVSNFEHLVIEHTGFANEEDQALLDFFQDSSFYQKLQPVSIFNQRVKDRVADYLLSHLKAVNTLRLLGVTHCYDYDEKVSAYYITYYKNKNTDKMWGCKLTYKLGKYRLAYQNVSALNDRDFVANYNRNATNINEAIQKVKP